MLTRRLLIAALLAFAGASACDRPDDTRRRRKRRRKRGRKTRPKTTAQPSTAQREDPPVVVQGKIQWVPFDPEVLAANTERGRPVFVHYTADWCPRCRYDLRFMQARAFKDKLAATGILPMRADLTRDNPAARQALDDAGGTGIPLYVVYLPNNRRIVLSTSITTRTLTDALDRAASTRASSITSGPREGVPSRGGEAS